MKTCLAGKNREKHVKTITAIDVFSVVFIQQQSPHVLIYIYVLIEQYWSNGKKKNNQYFEELAKQIE